MIKGVQRWNSTLWTSPMGIREKQRIKTPPLENTPHDDQNETQAFDPHGYKKEKQRIKTKPWNRLMIKGSEWNSRLWTSLPMVYKREKQRIKTPPLQNSWWPRGIKGATQVLSLQRWLRVIPNWKVRPRPWAFKDGLGFRGNSRDSGVEPFKDGLGSLGLGFRVLGFRV